jgi:hypothetical protein
MLDSAAPGNLILLWCDQNKFKDILAVPKNITDFTLLLL